jgi:hypothetical protein
MTGVSPFPQHPYLRLVPREPQPRRRLAVRISVLDSRAAFGRSRPFQIIEDDLCELVDVAQRLEARR